MRTALGLERIALAGMLFILSGCGDVAPKAGEESGGKAMDNQPKSVLESRFAGSWYSNAWG